MTAALYAIAERTRHAAVLTELDQIRARVAEHGRELSDAELRSVEDLTAEASRLAAAIAAYEADAARADENMRTAGELDARLERGAAQRTPPPPLMPHQLRAEQMRAAIAGGNTPLRFSTAESEQESRAAVTLAGDLGATAVPLGSRPLRDPRRLAVAAGLPTDPVTGMAEVVYPVFGNADAAGVVAEGDPKPEYDDVTPGSATPNLIALWTDFTLQAQITHPAFEGRLRQKLAMQVAKAEDLLLITTVLASGIPDQDATADPMAEQLLVAAGTVAANGAEPNLIVVNPADLGSILGVGLAATTPAELGESDFRLFGMQLYPTTAITAGTALVGAWPDSARFIVGLPPAYKVDPFTQMKNNKITVLLEEAVNIAVDEPYGFLSVDLVA